MADSGKPYEVLVVGPPGVGKTSVIHFLVTGDVLEEVEDAVSDNTAKAWYWGAQDKEVAVHFRELSGQSVTKEDLAGADGALLVFDIHNAEQFAEAKNVWKHLCLTHHGIDYPTVALANKFDLGPGEGMYPGFKEIGPEKSFFGSVPRYENVNEVLACLLGLLPERAAAAAAEAGAAEDAGTFAKWSKACKDGNLEEVQTLLAAGQDVNAVDEGCCGLSLAICNRQVEVVRELAGRASLNLNVSGLERQLVFEAVSEVDGDDEDTLTIVDLVLGLPDARVSVPSGDGSPSPLNWLLESRRCHAGVVEAILSHPSFDPNAEDEDFSDRFSLLPLMENSRLERKDVLRLGGTYLRHPKLDPLVHVDRYNRTILITALVEDANFTSAGCGSLFKLVRTVLRDLQPAAYAKLLPLRDSEKDTALDYALSSGKYLYAYQLAYDAPDITDPDLWAQTWDGAKAEAVTILMQVAHQKQLH
mmetsp:Transcript_23194/g.65141  ORF Transcript_23194/g.65141 Transcript_23194/m.65141 type:complete len:473 (+) Transcript_23194:69-1487(+)